MNLARNYSELLIYLGIYIKAVYGLRWCRRVCVVSVVGCNASSFFAIRATASVMWLIIIDAMNAAHR